MNPVEALFQKLRAGNRKAFIPFLPAGDPDLAFTRELIPAVAEAGGSLIEVGVPFSDPIADGPVIQASYTRALASGLKVADVFATLKEITATPGWQTPIVAMASYSLIWRKGPGAFLDAAKTSGLGGVVVPDLPVEEADELASQCRDRDLALTLLVTPTTAPDRAEKIVRACTGFVYVVSVVGITGERAMVSDQVRAVIGRLRGLTDRPLCVGFGVSKPEHVRALRDLADGVIVGSALVRKLELAGTPGGRERVVAEMQRSVSELSRALDH
jgi:tryptophan synthase alpha chain